MKTIDIFNYLVKAGLTNEGAAGLMGNLYAESGLISNRVEILCLKRLKEAGKIYTDSTYTAFVDDGTITRAKFLHPLPGKQYGYGLAQWTSPTRKGKLYDKAKAAKKSIGDMKMQLEFLVDELKTSYKSVYNTLTTTNDISLATDVVLKKFESPADTGAAVLAERKSYAIKYYSECVGYGVTAETILDIFRSWLGKKEADGTHREIIDIYNSYKPLARGYKVQYTDQWCDTAVSAAFIKAKAVSLIGGTECGVQEHVNIFKKAGIWMGMIKPVPGDILVFDWQSDKYGDHIGIVEKVVGNLVTTIEGNYQDSVRRRVIGYNNSQIMGYARPKYASSESEQLVSVIATKAAERFDKTLAGTYTTTINLNMRYGPSSKKYDVMVQIPKGSKVQNYGYFSLNGSAKWLYVQAIVDGIKYTGFCSKGGLKKA